MTRRTDRLKSLAGAGVLTILTVGALVGLLSFFNVQGLENSEKWASIFNLPVAVLALVAPLVIYLVRRGRQPAERSETPAVDRLRAAVERMWRREISARQLHLPHPLVLRWTSYHDLQLGAVVGSNHEPAQDLAGSLMPDNPDRPAAADLADAFRQQQLRQLVILGSAGAGKTTVAILFTLAVIDAGEADGAVPVLLSVAGWDPTTGETIADWIARAVARDYPQVSEDECRQMLEACRLVVVLDGLDEMAPGARHAALTQLEERAAIGLRTVITCRLAEFRDSVLARGPLPQAELVCLGPVHVSDAARYLTGREFTASVRWAGVIGAIRADPAGRLATALSTPLMISLARQVYQDHHSDPGELIGLPSWDDAADVPPDDTVQGRLLARFLPSVYGSAVQAGKAEAWLAASIRYMSGTDGGPNLQWWRLPVAVPRRVIAALVILTMAGTGAVIGLVGAAAASAIGVEGTNLLAWTSAGGLTGLVIGPLTGLPAARAAHAPLHPEQRITGPRAIGAGLAEVLVIAGTLSLVCAVFLLALLPVLPGHAARAALTVEGWGRQISTGEPDAVAPSLVILFGLLILVVITAGLSARRAGTPRQSTPDLRRLPRHLWSSVGVGVLIGSPWTILGLLRFVDLDLGTGLVLNAICTGMVAVPLGIGRWLSSPVKDVEDYTSPASALRNDRRALFLSTGAVGTVAALVLSGVMGFVGDVDFDDFVLSMFITGAAAAAIVFFGSGSPWLSYTVARLWLALLGRVPWRLMTFLRDAHRRGVLRQIGPAYQLRHGLIQDLLLRNRPADRRQPAAHRRHMVRRRSAVVLSAATVATLALPATAFAIVALGPVGARCLVGQWRETSNHQYDHSYRTWTTTTGQRIRFAEDGSGTLYLDNAVSTTGRRTGEVHSSTYAGVIEFRYEVREDWIIYRPGKSSAEVTTERGTRTPMAPTFVDDTFTCVADTMTLEADSESTSSMIELERIE